MPSHGRLAAEHSNIKAASEQLQRACLIISKPVKEGNKFVGAGCLSLHNVDQLACCSSMNSVTPVTPSDTVRDINGLPAELPTVCIHVHTTRSVHVLQARKLGSDRRCMVFLFAYTRTQNHEHEAVRQWLRGAPVPLAGEPCHWEQLCRHSIMEHIGAP